MDCAVVVIAHHMCLVKCLVAGNKVEDLHKKEIQALFLKDHLNDDHLDQDQVLWNVQRWARCLFQHHQCMLQMPGERDHKPHVAPVYGM